MLWPAPEVNLFSNGANPSRSILMKKSRTAKKRKAIRQSGSLRSRKLFRHFIKTVFVLISLSVLWVFVYKFVNPPITWLMVSRSLSEQTPKDLPKRKWIDYQDLSTNLKQAAIAGEDAHFLTHHGFDTKAIKAAYQRNQSGKPLRGGSTISQQTAKNVFLWPQRSWLRKGLEVWFTLLVEIIWGKERILEVYLNVIETGNGLYGMDAAARHYFKKSAKSLTKRQAALLVAVLPNPRRWRADRPTAFINRKAATIARYMPSTQIP